jgi:septal ring factor EnvC (AmiA/AmiB activator)
MSRFPRIALLVVLAAPAWAVAQTGYIQRLGVMDRNGNMVYRYYDEKGQRINYTPATGRQTVRDMDPTVIRSLIGKANEAIVRSNKQVEDFVPRDNALREAITQHRRTVDQHNQNAQKIREAYDTARRLAEQAENINIIGSAGSAAWADSMNRKIEARRQAREYREKVDAANANLNEFAEKLNAQGRRLNQEHAAIEEERTRLKAQQQELGDERQSLSQALNHRLKGLGFGDHRPANER